MASSDFTAAVMTASRALVGIAARSLADVESEVTLQQYRALVVLAGRGDERVGDLADALAIHQSTTSRLCDRLVAKGLISRAASTESRREVVLSLTAEGRSLLDAVTERRRREIQRIGRKLSPAARDDLVAAFTLLADAAGELPDDAWRLGWT